ncbi:glycosyl hydrolase family 61-domain-containing protein [Penicillium longicatenatum]|uniref:glycosyl hydrolase family 61-domain-containing protein n=1 Tax=Penicillium longicatenatum TaxID=1561947 RepID=UPI002549BB64|nr:glycosyl hydrolase family 61-domain-containing protein [Penicillium longicatenatum]KAJ5648794.1 glycosyl hydrolase family 61-domain-containing protein [Penicillium longicatenatum]
MNKNGGHIFSLIKSIVPGIHKVKAGDTIGFGLDFGATIQHPAPMQVYLSKAPGDVKDYDGSGDWFKVYELGPTERVTTRQFLPMR